jgi:serine/threonine-protein kinase
VPEAARYEIGGLLGEGGMGRVYRGTLLPSGRVVALKVLRTDYRGEMANRGLLQEAAAAARLAHPSIVDLLDLTWDTDGSPVLVMELVEGTSVESWIGDFPGWSVVRTGLLQALEGLCAAHAAGVVHRDLKPSNLLIATDGRVRIADFGIARIANPLETHHSTGRVLGTPHYMAPEQLDRFGDIGPWTDLYAFGTVLWELYHGRLPFMGGLAELAVQKRLGELPTHAPRPGLDASFELVVLMKRLLDPMPRRRLRFAAEAHRALASIEVASRSTTRPAMPSRARATVESPPGETPTELRDDLSEERTLHALGTGDGPTLAFTSVQPAMSRTAPPQDLPATHAGGSLLRLRTVPVAGRSEIQAEISTLVEEVCDRGRARVLVLVGPAGVGKSRLARWMLGEVERRGVMEGAAAGYAFGGAGVEGGLRHALSRLVGPAKAAWSWPLADEHPGFDVSAARDWLEGTIPAPDTAVALVRSALEVVCSSRPVALWLDDFGWSDDGAIQLVEGLLERPDIPVFAVCTLRSGTAEHPAVRGNLSAILAHDDVRVIDVEPLRPEGLRQLVDGVMPLAEELVDAIAEQSDARPLVALTRLYDWVEQGAVELVGGTWRPVPGKSVHELLDVDGGTLFGARIAAFVDGFEDARDAARGLLLRAAALGERFDEPLLRASATGDPELRDHVATLLDRALLGGILRFEDDAHAHYQFDHGLLREHLLDELASDPAGRDIAREAVAAIEARYAGRRPDLGARTAYLLWQAGDQARAIDAMLQASQQLARLGAFPRAEELELAASRWIDDTDAGADESAALIYTRANRMYHALQYTEALDYIERHRDVLERGRPALAAQVWQLELQIYFFSLQLSQAESRGRALVERLSPPSGDSEIAMVLSGTDQILMEIAILRGDVEGAREHARSSFELAEASGITWRKRFAEVLMHDVALLMGEPDGCPRDRLDELRRDAQADDDATHSTVTEVLMRDDFTHGRWEPARERAERYLERHVRQRDRWRETAMRVVLAAITARTRGRSETARVTTAMLDSFEDAPHDEWFSHLCLEQLAGELGRLGETALAGRVARLLASRRDAIRRGFEGE